MEQFVGLDVSQEVTHLCVANIKGNILWQGKCASTPDAIADTIKVRAPKVTRVGLESGPLSTWHWHALNAMGFPVVCLDARHAKAALSVQVNKTDKNDAYGLAQIVRTGWYKEVNVKGLDTHTTRSLLSVRAQLVGMRVEIMNQTRGILKTFGIVMRSKPGMSFEQHAEELIEGDGLLQSTLRSLLAVLRSIGEQIAGLGKDVRQYTRQSKVCRHLMTIPGVGPVTAAAFVTAVEDPGKFRKSKSVGAFLGLTPRRYQSGETDVSGRISKCGDELTRTYLYEAATTLLSKIHKWSALKAWGLRIAKGAA